MTLRILNTNFNCMLSVAIIIVPSFPNQAGISSTDTNDPFYVGGVPDGAAFSALRTSDKFVGCVRNFRFENRTQPLSDGDQFGDVNVGSCPTT